MKIEQEYLAFVKEYIRLEGKIDAEMLDKLYQFNVHSAYNFLQSNKKYCPPMDDYPHHIKRIATLYWSLK